jgi:hypothetical protein
VLVALTVFFGCRAKRGALQAAAKIDRSMPMVAETKPSPDRENSRLKSRARAFDGPG